MVLTNGPFTGAPPISYLAEFHCQVLCFVVLCWFFVFKNYSTRGYFNSLSPLPFRMHVFYISPMLAGSTCFSSVLWKQLPHCLWGWMSQCRNLGLAKLTAFMGNFLFLSCWLKDYFFHLEVHNLTMIWLLIHHSWSFSSWDIACPFDLQI